ncbi:MAG: AAA domain-containing protein [Archaeoglobaceae archaeon]
MKDWLRRLIDYFLLVELFSLKQDQFSVNYKNRLLRKEIVELYLLEGLKKRRKDDFNGLFFKVHLGTLQFGTLVDYTLRKFNEAGIPLCKDNDLEQIEELKRDKSYISLGYFYLNPKGQFIAKSDNIYVKVLPFVFLLTLLEVGGKEKKKKDRRDIRELIGNFQDYFERALSEFSKYITENYKTREGSLTRDSLIDEYLFSSREESLPSLCFILDSSAILDRSFNAEYLRELKDCILCVTPQVLREIDLKKKAKGYIRDQALKFRRVFDELVTKASKSQPIVSLSQGLWYPSPESDKKFSIVSPYFDRLRETNPSYFGVDSEADMSVIIAALEFSKVSFPIVVATDRAFKWSILQRTPFVGFSRTVDLDLVFSDVELLEKMEKFRGKYCISYNSLVDLERKFFDFFRLQDLYKELSLFKGEELVKRHGFVTVEIVPGGVEEVAKALSEDDVNYIIKDLTLFRKKFLEEKVDSSVKVGNRSSESRSNGSRKSNGNRVRGRTEETEFPRLIKLFFRRELDKGDSLQDSELSKLNLSDLRDALKCLFAQKVPVGRYASPYLPTLLQQIAINQALELQEGQILAVNGPPGTGKTTLLKEIIANLVIKRALEIAKLKGEIFTDKGVLHKKVSKFKMVVVSNNNAAVENVTLELPKLNGVKEALHQCGEEYVNFNYLGTVIKEYFKAKDEDKRDTREGEESEGNAEKERNLELFSGSSINDLEPLEEQKVGNVSSKHLVEQDIENIKDSSLAEGKENFGENSTEVVSNDLGVVAESFAAEIDNESEIGVRKSEDKDHGKDKGNEDKKEEYFGLLALPLGKFENREKAARALSFLVEFILEAIDKKLHERRAEEKTLNSTNEAPLNGVNIAPLNEINGAPINGISSLSEISSASLTSSDFSTSTTALTSASTLDVDPQILDAEFPFSSEKELNEYIEKLCNEIIQLEEEIKRETEKIFTIVREKTKVISRMKSLSKVKNELEGKLNEFRRKLESLDSEENALFNEITKAKVLYDSLIKELSELESVKFSSFSKLKAILDTKLKKQIEEHKRLYELKKSEVKECELAIREKETRLKLLKKDKEVLLQKIDSVLRDYNEVEGKYADLERKLCFEDNSVDLSLRPFGKLDFANSIYSFVFLERDILTDEQKKEVFKSSPYDFVNTDLSVKRIKLFLKALELHKLVIFKHRKRFSFLLKKFISILRSPRVEVRDDDFSLEDLWNVFFFVVPVTSTTLASFSRGFGLVEDEFIDYLLVDEAGQAQVHSFVMPLVKSKRAIVVGDPFQIEPVYNITSGLDDILRDFFDIPVEYAVTENSVQTYADRVSLLGGVYEVGGKKVRVGVPLNVHRRCNSPMFDVANKIAYSDCMIKGKKDSFKVRDLLPERLRSSRWFHVDFKPNESGVVEEEIKLLSELLSKMEESLTEKGIDVRDFVKKGNIFVITPFRAVRDRLRELERKGGIHEYLVREGSYIGTIHTFQGKEANIVFIVLGGRSERSMAWASSKPNLLNVALTRAKELCYIIGDKNLWGRMPYFKEAVRILDGF